MGAPGKWIAGAALVASLGLNAFLLRGAHRDAEAVRVQRAKLATQAPEPAPRASDDACRAELTRCHADGWKLLARTLTERAGRGDAGDVARSVAAGSRATPQRQREALCEIAREHLRAHWEAEKETLLRNVVADSTGPEKQAQQARTTSARMADALGLAPGQADGLAAEYLPVYTGHVNGLLAALGADPPDYEAVLGEVKGLYADEDAMIGRLRGDGAVELWRAHEIQDRTAIMAIAATFAQDPWDDTIVW
jgi:hypothetical protein